MDIPSLYDLYRRAKGVTTDSRQCAPGMLFFALKGERFDGNVYARQALEQGCIAAVVDAPELRGEPGMVWVEDGLRALQGLAWFHRRKMTCPVIGLTGSNGKTTTKELLREVLSKRYRTHATQGNLNNHIGVPLTLLGIPLEPAPEMVVLEMGANHQGEIRDLCAIGEPTHGVITNIGRAHLEGFGGPEGVKAGKRELFQFLAQHPGGCVWVNGRHPVLMEVSDGMTRKIFGVPGQFPWGETCEAQDGGFAGGVRVWTQPGEREVIFGVHVAGEHNLDNVMLALAVGMTFDVPVADAIAAISAYRPTNNRSQWVNTAHNRVLLDAYNANPSSVEATLVHFAQHHPEPRAVIIGDMAEMGDYAAEEHAGMLEQMMRLGLRGHLVGPLFEAAWGRLKPDSLVAWPDTEALGRYLEAHPYEKTDVLVKGSRSMALERLLPYL